jgi:hypothetical protein
MCIMFERKHSIFLGFKPLSVKLIDFFKNEHYKYDMFMHDCPTNPTFAQLYAHFCILCYFKSSIIGL